MWRSNQLCNSGNKAEGISLTSWTLVPRSSFREHNVFRFSFKSVQMILDTDGSCSYEGCWCFVDIVMIQRWKCLLRIWKKKSKLRLNDSKNELIINVRCIKCFINVPSSSKQTVNMENGLYALLMNDVIIQGTTKVSLQQTMWSYILHSRLSTLQLGLTRTRNKVMQEHFSKTYYGKSFSVEFPSDSILFAVMQRALF